MCFIASSAWAQQPGALLDVSYDGTLRPDQIDRTVAKLYDAGSPPSARYAVDVYVIRFVSEYPDGTAAPVTAQLFLPRLEIRGEVPVYVFGPGSTGLVDPCRVSREHIAGIHWGYYRAHVLSHAAQGMIGALPDYPGFGDPERLQPYFVAETAGRMMLNAVRAVHSVAQDLAEGAMPAEGAFLAGFSQGGHAAFAAADIQAEYAPDVPLGGIIGYGPTTDMEALFREFTVVAPMVIYTYAQLYGADAFDPALILAERWLRNLEYDVTRQCVGGIQSYYPWTPRALYRPAFANALLSGRLAEEFPQIHRILAENTTGLAGHGVPALILQGTDDIVVYQASQTQFVSELRATGSEVRYLIYDGARHDTRQIGFHEVQMWMTERLRRMRTAEALQHRSLQ